MFKISNVLILIILTLVASIISGLPAVIVDLWNSNIFSITINTTLTVNNDVSTTMEYNKIHLPIINPSTGLFSSL